MFSVDTVLLPGIKEPVSVTIPVKLLKTQKSSPSSQYKNLFDDSPSVDSQ